ncbi:MAG: TolB family protein, partial [Polyangiaceae bacterium]
STTNGTCAGTLIGQIAGYSDVIDVDSDGTSVYFVDAANEQIGQVSAYSLGTPVLLSGSLPGVVSVVYDAASSLVVFDQQATSTTTALYKATPGVASSAVKFGTVNGSPGSNAIAVSSLGQVDALTALTSSTAQAYNCTITGTCNPVSTAFSSTFMNGVTWPGNQTEPYWADQTNGNIVTFVPSCSCYSNLATGLTAPASPTTDGTYVYWMQVSGTLQIHRVAIAGGSVQNLGTLGDNNQVQNLTTDGKYVYWSGLVGGVAGIYYLPVAGGAPQLLTTVPEGMPVRVHKESTTGQTVVYYGDTANATVDKVIAPP